MLELYKLDVCKYYVQELSEPCERNHPHLVSSCLQKLYCFPPSICFTGERLLFALVAHLLSSTPKLNHTNSPQQAPPNSCTRSPPTTPAHADNARGRGCSSYPQQHTMGMLHRQVCVGA